MKMSVPTDDIDLNKITVEKGRKSVYGIARNLQKLLLHLCPKLMRKKLYANILLKNIENDNDNFETVVIELK